MFAERIQVVSRSSFSSVAVAWAIASHAPPTSFWSAGTLATRARSACSSFTLEAKNTGSSSASRRPNVPL